MSTAVRDIIRISKHKDASTFYEYDWSSWLRTGDSLSSDINDHTFTIVDAASGLTISDKEVSGNKTYCIISGGNPSIAEWRVKIAAKGTLDPDEIGVIELWITVWGD